jgi:hypothetical protein
MGSGGGRLGLQLVRGNVAPVELDRHDAKHVFPVGLVPKDLAQLRLGRFAA